MPNLNRASGPGDQAAQEDAEFSFSSEYTPNLPALLKRLNISLVLTSYQSRRVVLIRTDGSVIDTNFKAFPRPMGLAVEPDRLVVGIWSQILDYSRNDELVADLEPKGVVDACFVPRASHVTGMINIHDIAWGTDGLWIVNSEFSCLATVEPEYSFVPRWKPPFISELVPEDRCHLNGMAMKDGQPAYVTSFDDSDSNVAWRYRDRMKGQLIDVASNRALADDLVLPHSPRYYRGTLYVCESGYGRVVKVDPKTGHRECLAELPGFTRGLAFYGPLMFVGLSKIRRSEHRQKVPIDDMYDDGCSGVYVINLEDESCLASLVFEGDVSQIYDVAVLPGACWPELVEWDDDLVKRAFSFPDIE